MVMLANPVAALPGKSACRNLNSEMYINESIPLNDVLLSGLKLSQLLACRYCIVMLGLFIVYLRSLSAD